MKIIVVGDPGTGKSALFQQFCGGSSGKTFQREEYKPTIGVDYNSKRLRVPCDATTSRGEGDSIATKEKFLQIWDVAGTERTSPLMRTVCKNAHGALCLVRSPPSPETLQAATMWKEAIDQFATIMPNSGDRIIPCLLVVSMADATSNGKSDDAEVDRTLKDYCQRQGFAGWVRTSCMDRASIEACFALLVDHVDVAWQAAAGRAGGGPAVVSFQPRKRTIGCSGCSS